jgi:hypothetical protein
MTPYRRNRTLREFEKRRALPIVEPSLTTLKIMIDAAIVRGEKSVSLEIRQFILEIKHENDNSRLQSHTSRRR